MGSLAFSKEKVLETFMDDEELLVDSISTFLENVRTRFAKLKEAVSGRTVDVIMAEAHTIKGMMGYFSDGPPYEAAKKLEFMGREKNLDGVDEALADLETNLEKLNAVLKSWIA
ncbi:MAG: Hpt domain-containing protein [Deltaproteobacteria bacterium]|nr:Hpt domain-containing protein [Deltaproteobacteria bacterium]